MPQVPIVEGRSVGLAPLQGGFQQAPDVSAPLRAAAQGLGEAADAGSRIVDRDTQRAAYDTQAKVQQQWIGFQQDYEKNRTGEKAQNLTADVNAWWAKTREAAAQNLDPMSQQMVGRALQASYLTAVAGAGHFENAQLEAATDAAWKAAKTTTIGQAASNPLVAVDGKGPDGEPARITASEAAVADLRRKNAEYAQRKGLPAEVLQAMNLQDTTALHTQALQTIAESGGDAAGPMARSYFDQHKDQIDGTRQAELEKAYVKPAFAAAFENAATTALTAQNETALGDLVKRVQGPEGDQLDPNKRAQLTHQFYGWQQHVIALKTRALNQAEAEQLRRENAAIDVYNKATDVTLSGGFMSPEFITELTTAAEGTTMSKPVLDLIASQKDVAGFASRSATQRAALIERMRNERATPGVGTDPFRDKLLTAMTTMDGKLRSAVDDNPWAAAQQAGVIQDAPVIDASNPQTAMAIVKARMQALNQVETWAGRKVSPLQPQEVEQIGKMVRQLPLDQAATMLSNFGATVGDSDRVAAMAKQMHDKDGALGLAMLYAGAQTTQGRVTAELILRGDEAIKDKRVLVDKMAETGWQGSIAKAIRGVFSDHESENAAVEAAFKIAAAKYAENGSANINEAVRLATGGIVERNGQRFPLPYGMKEDQFNQALAAIKPADLSAQAPDGQVFVGRTPMPLEAFVATLSKASLVDAGQGLYNVRAGMATVTNSQGKRITLKVAP